MYRRRVELTAATGLPRATLTVGDSNGRLTYLTAAYGGHGIAVPLDDDQVARLAAALLDRLRERDDDTRPAGRGLLELESSTTGSRSVQNCTDLEAPPVVAGGAFTGVNRRALGASHT